MKKVEITVLRKAEYRDLIEKFENPLENACSMQEGQIFCSENAERPEGFCESAWENLYPFVFALSNGAESFFDGWLKEKRSAIVSCNDGLRPVSFYLKAK